MDNELGIEGLSEVSEIGRGGGARVYKARQVNRNRFVTVKVLNEPWANATYGKFEASRRAVLSLGAPDDIVPIVATGTTRYGKPFVQTPYYVRGTLEHEVAYGRAMNWRRAVALMQSVSGTVMGAHEHGMVHGNLKPGNIVIAENGRPRIADFELSQLMRPHNPTLLAATPSAPAFAAPELLTLGHEHADTAASPRSDVYALGATLFNLVSGAPPFVTDGEATDGLLVLDRVARQPVPDLRASVPGAVCDVIEKAMNKRPEDRHADASEFLSHLRSASHSSPTSLPETDPDTSPVPAAPLFYPAQDAARPSRLMRAAMAVWGVGGLAIGAWFLTGRGDAGDEGNVSVAASVQVTQTTQPPPTSGTRPDAVDLVITDAVVSSISETSARVEFKTNVCAGSQYTVNGEVHYESGFPAKSQCTQNHSAVLGTPPFSQEPLQPGTPYEVRVDAFLGDGSAAVDAQFLNFLTGPRTTTTSVASAENPDP